MQHFCTFWMDPARVGRRWRRVGFSVILRFVWEPLCVLPQHHHWTRQQHALHLYLHPHLHISKQESHCTHSSTTWMVSGRLTTQSCCYFICPQSCHFIRWQRGRHGVGGIRRVGCRHDEEGRLTKMNTLLYYYLSLNHSTYITLHCCIPLPSIIWFWGFLLLICAHVRILYKVTLAAAAWNCKFAAQLWQHLLIYLLARCQPLWTHTVQVMLFESQPKFLT